MTLSHFRDFISPNEYRSNHLRGKRVSDHSVSRAAALTAEELNAIGNAVFDAANHPQFRHFFGHIGQCHIAVIELGKGAAGVQMVHAQSRCHCAAQETLTQGQEEAARCARSGEGVNRHGFLVGCSGDNPRITSLVASMYADSLNAAIEARSGGVALAA